MLQKSLGRWYRSARAVDGDPETRFLFPNAGINCIRGMLRVVSGNKAKQGFLYFLELAPKHRLISAKQLHQESICSVDLVSVLLAFLAIFSGIFSNLFLTLGEKLSKHIRCTGTFSGKKNRVSVDFIFLIILSSIPFKMSAFL